MCLFYSRMAITERSYVKKERGKMCFFDEFVQKCTLFRASKYNNSR